MPWKVSSCFSIRFVIGPVNMEAILLVKNATRSRNVKNCGSEKHYWIKPRLFSQLGNLSLSLFFFFLLSFKFDYCFSFDPKSLV